MSSERFGAGVESWIGGAALLRRLMGRPVGAYVIRGGEVTWKPAVDVNRLAIFAFLLGLVFALKR